MKKHLLVSLGLIALTFQACGPGDGNIPTSLPDAQALGPDTTTPPAGATLIDAPSFLVLYQQNLLRISNSPGQFEDLSLVSPSAPSGASAAMAPAAAANPSITFHGKDGADHHIELLSDSDKNARVSSATQKFATQANQLQIYRHMHGGVIPDGISGLSSDQLRALNKSEAAMKATTTQIGTATGASGAVPALSCTGDLGAGPLGSDHTGDGTSCDTHSATGLYAGYNWSLKPSITCIKDQGNRGTCGAFGIVATLETEIAATLNLRVNLSEQDLYSHVKNNWWPTYYGDGISPDGVWQQMISTNYVVPFESLWDYNPSNWRTNDSANAGYLDSCTNYNEDCSNTAHQAKLLCTTSNNLLFCGYTSPANTSQQGFRATGETEIWDGGDTVSSINSIGAMIAANKAVNIGINVPPTFDNPDSNGYASYVAKDGPSRGGHLVTVVGFITNATLAQTIPAAPQGAGGGYLIVKNSWGLCWGDGGFIYLPFSWASVNVWAASVLDDLVQQ